MLKASHSVASPSHSVASLTLCSLPLFLLFLAAMPVQGMTVGLRDLKNEEVSSSKFARGFITYREVVVTPVVQAKVMSPELHQHILDTTDGDSEFLGNFRSRLMLSNLYLTPIRMRDYDFSGTVDVVDSNPDVVDSDDFVADMGSAGNGGFVSKARADSSDLGDDLPSTVSALSFHSGLSDSSEILAFSPVPEPSKMVLALLGMVGALAQRRRRGSTRTSFYSPVSGIS